MEKDKREEITKIKIEVFFEFMRKIIETAIDYESKIESDKYYGYIAYSVDTESPFFYMNSTFDSMMKNKEIIFKTKLPIQLIYLPLYILSELINRNNPYGIPTNIEERFLHHFFKDDDEIPISNMVIIKNFMEKTGEEWFKLSGIGNEYIFNFEETIFGSYEYHEGNYLNFIGSKKQFKQHFKSEERIESQLKRVFDGLKKSSKFHRESPPLKEFTLQEMLNYIDQLRLVYSYVESKKTLNPDILIESKHPKLVQKYLDLGYTIEEVLDFVGYIDT
jgi:hypothetical protein